MPFKSVKIKTIFFIYWFLLLYIIAALVWWFIALYQQNERMADYKIHLLTLRGNENTEQINIIEQNRLRKRGQYIGEGSIFLLIISAGAIFLFRAVNKQLKLTRQKQDFMMAVTHELKTPLASMKLYLQTMEKRQLDEGARAKLIAQAIQENTRLELLIDNILNASRIENNALNPVLSDQDLHAVLNDLVNRFGMMRKMMKNMGQFKKMLTRGQRGAGR